MGALVNVFKSLLGGILGFFGGLIGGKKGKDGFFMEADAATMEDLPAAAPASAAPVAAVAVEAAPAAAKAGKGKKDKAVKAAPMQAPAKVARVMTPEELIVAAVQAKPVDATAAAAGGTAGFATQYLVPTLTSGRRSPGPSLKMFKTMAKEIRG
jgi:hypothetical protein